MPNWDWSEGLCFAGIFAFAAAVSILCTMLCRWIAVRIGFMDIPKHEAHKGHRQATPLLGGLAMYLALLASWPILRFLPFFPDRVTPFFGVLAGATLALLLGMADDKYGMSAQWKFLGQLIVAGCAVFGSGVKITLFIGDPALSAAITLFWYMTLMNAINFFDNMDGLAAGTSTIALMFFGVTAALLGQEELLFFIVPATGVAVGFWCFNRAPAKIFMGDSGSLLLGFLLSTVSCSINYFNPARSLSRFPILIPLFILAVPLFDAMMVVLIRSCRGKPFWIGDRNHISHRFVKMGLSRPAAVNLVHGLCVFAGLSIFPIMYGNFTVAAAVVVQMFILLLIVSFLQFNLARKEHEND